MAASPVHFDFEPYGAHGRAVKKRETQNKKGRQKNARKKTRAKHGGFNLPEKTFRLLYQKTDRTPFAVTIVINAVHGGVFREERGGGKAAAKNKAYRPPFHTVFPPACFAERHFLQVP
jgi:hypothetical protein